LKLVNSTVIAALIRRDRLIVTSYRLSFGLELFHGIVGLALYFFISKTFEGFSSSDLGAAPTYFAYAAVGVVMGGVLDATSSGVGYRIREEQVTGTLEAVSTAPVTSLDLCLGLMGFPFFFASARAAFYLVVAAILMGLDVGSTSWIGLALVFLATGAAMAPIGILAGAAVLVMKRGQVISGTLVYLMTILAGMVFPISVLPDWLEALSALIPLRYAFDGARQALFAGSGWEDDVLALIAFAVILWPLSVLLFSKAGAWARRAGSLSEY
jgi:ABC-2 type transport system permease protein